MLVLQKSVFIEIEVAQQCVTMRKRFSPIMATPFFNKPSIFDPRPENCLSFSEKSPPKIV